MAFPIQIPATGNAGRILADNFAALETAMPGKDGSLPGLVVAMPTAWANKYQLLLYSAAADRRFAVVGARTPADLERISWPGPVVFHAHWFASTFATARSNAEARMMMNRACDQILEFRDRTGARLLWSAHNVFPHGNQFPDVFLELRQWTFKTFDAIHVMDAAHVPVLEEAFATPAPQSFVVPHMTYDGTILDSVTTATARTHFRVPQDAFVFSFFGSIQNYKGLERFLEAFEKVRATQPRRVVAIIGGIASDTEVARRLDQRWGTDPDIRLELRKIADHEIQYLHRAADVMMLPYAESLNSGAAYMAATFRKPFLMPIGRASEPLEGLGAIRYDGQQPEALVEAMLACLSGKPPAAKASQFKALQPERISNAFFDCIEILCDRG